MFYKYILGAVFQSLGVPSSSLPFIEESSYALTPAHILDVYRLCALSSQQEIRRTGDEVGASTTFGPMLTPVLQALDENYQHADSDFGGLDQRGLFNYAEDFLPKIGYRKRMHLMNDMLPGLNGGKMSASLPNSKIDCLDGPDVVRRKILAVSCDKEDLASNGLLALIRLVLIPVSELRLERTQGKTGYSGTEGTGVCQGQTPFSGKDAPSGTVFTIDDHHYTNYRDIESDYLAGRLSESALKNAVIDAVNSLLAGVRAVYLASPEWQAVEQVAYPQADEEFVSTHGAGEKVEILPLPN